jgi:hypothetical protein
MEPVMVEPDDTVYWEDETRTAIRVDFSLHVGQIVSAQERVSLIYRAYALARTVTHEVSLLVDLRAPVTVRAANWLTLIRQLTEARPANVARVIVVGSRQSALYQRVLDILRHIRTDLVETHFVATLEEAHTLAGIGREADRGCSAGAR